MTPRHMAMAGAVALTAWLALFGDKTPDTEIAEPVTRTTSASVRVADTGSTSAANAPGDKAKRAAVILPLKAREQLMSGTTAETTEPRPEKLFISQSWTPPPPPPVAPPPPPPPSAPPLPYTYIGKKIEAGKWEVYLALGDRNYVVREQSNLEGVYRVDSITASLLTMTYLPLNQTQTITIGGID